MVDEHVRRAFEHMAGVGKGDAGALALGLRNGVTGLGLRALAAKAVHVAAAAPERLTDIYDNAAAGWLSGPVFQVRPRNDDPLPISKTFWRNFWELVSLPPTTRQQVFAQQVLRLAGELDPRINGRMAAAALEYPGLTKAAAGGIPDPIDIEALGSLPPASLGYAVHQEAHRAGNLAEPFTPIVPLLRHMPSPLGYINVQVIQTLPAMSLVAGYSASVSRLDQIAQAGFLMGQVAHHYSALSTAVTLTALSLERPETLELILDSVFKGWAHGRETPLLVGVNWSKLWALRVDQVREMLGVTPFASPAAAAARQLSREPRH